MFPKRVPKWVIEYPIEIEKQALIALANSSNGPFEKSREMNFSLYGFAEGRELDEAMSRISEHGWKCMVEPQADEPGKFLLTAQKEPYSITEQNYKQDVQYFRRIANLYHVGFDGWLASN